MAIRIPRNVQFIMSILETRNFEAFVVGGAVRDSLAGFAVKDWDVATNARPETVAHIFNSLDMKVIPTGIEHGTVTVMMENEPIEITTFRNDVNFDGGHQCEVSFVGSIFEDMERRDFTINSIALDINGEIVDPFDGVGDINRRIIRFVGDSNSRIVEDPLRMLRAIRFHAQKGFVIANDTWNAIVENADLIKNISMERIRDEVVKIIDANPNAVWLLHESGLLSHFLTEVDVLFHTRQNNPHHRFDNVGEHTINAMINADGVVRRLALLLHDTGKAMVREADEDGIDRFHGHEEVSVELARVALRRLRFDNEIIAKIIVLIANHGKDIVPTRKSVKRAINRVGLDNFLELVEVKVADDRAKNTSREDVQKRIIEASLLREIFFDIVETREPFNRAGLAVDGHDMIALGFHGREIRDVLEYLVDCVIDVPEINNKERLIEIASGFSH